jgi:PHYB activation tagged suppressor 1
MKKLLGGGSVASKGEKWFTLQKISNHAFHAGCLKVVLFLFSVFILVFEVLTD